ncbi:sigma 54-interacting transcriptional regulator [Clostridium algidicarnis]|uniref:Sigma 54-interacting transcriptional regulator n=1 Tax=Clostridium algidicarnis TaxID=37659 RepID=A0ABS6C3E0_9CLOT|nr:sigma-54-dependent transcriptional regulator [Clostridium algidicarnis]MBU3220006.1 sigma 54-interacting transcriptional regulator [Clostridium algidicarnis]
MKTNKDEIFKFIEDSVDTDKKGLSAGEIGKRLNLQRSNVSSILNELHRDGLLLKIKGKPVIYTLDSTIKSQGTLIKENANFNMLIGNDKSLEKCIQQAKAAMLYPPKGLHTLILGPSGVGKTMFAELMYKFGVENNLLKPNSPFVSFNCSDYANNPQLLLAHLFGCKKGAFTGADKDREGIVGKANGGVLFLDEVHRLPPEGQEMLFYLIDKGLYSSLGDDNKKKCEVLIMCATTEDIDEVLLTTFTRRIPMNIKIPALKDRSLDERFELICEFFTVEAARIGKDISVSLNTVRQLMLHNCQGNIGQLKSDIQLGCANAFLNSVSKKLKNIEVHCTDFASYVNQGLLIYKNHANEIDKIIKSEKTLYFTPKGPKSLIKEGDYSLPDNFYEGIEKKMEELHKRGIKETEIKLLMEFDIENYFKTFIKTFSKSVKKDELSKIVDEGVIVIVESFLDIASHSLRKVFQSKVFYGLCLHINSSINRIKSGKSIVNHNLENIKRNYNNEYEVSKELAVLIENAYHIKVPEDEIGFIAMFLTVNEIESETLKQSPIVVIAMHGRTTASSMAEVVNKLVGADNTYAYDMALDKSPKVAYYELKNLIIKTNEGGGVILLVDMGSLSMFGELISKDTGIEIKVLDMVSTAIAIECSRKAVIESDVQAIYYNIRKSLDNCESYNIKVADKFIPKNDNIIITLCTTGEGSAIKLKDFIESKINTQEYNVEIFPMALNNKQHTYNTLNNIAKEKNILAIVGTINPNIYGIPYISTYDIFMDSNCNSLIKILEGKKEVSTNNSFIEVLSKDIKNMDLYKFEILYNDFLKQVTEKTGKKINYDVSIGLMVHMICSTSNIIEGKMTSSCYSKDVIKEQYKNEYKIVKNALKKIEENYNIIFNEDEICFIIRNIMSI